MALHVSEADATFDSALAINTATSQAALYTDQSFKKGARTAGTFTANQTNIAPPGFFFPTNMRTWLNTITIFCRVAPTTSPQSFRINQVTGGVASSLAVVTLPVSQRAISFRGLAADIFPGDWITIDCTAVGTSGTDWEFGIYGGNPVAEDVPITDPNAFLVDNYVESVDTTALTAHLADTGQANVLVLAGTAYTNPGAQITGNKVYASASNVSYGHRYTTPATSDAYELNWDMTIGRATTVTNNHMGVAVRWQVAGTEANTVMTFRHQNGQFRLDRFAAGTQNPITAVDSTAALGDVVHCRAQAAVVGSDNRYRLWVTLPGGTETQIFDILNNGITGFSRYFGIRGISDPHAGAGTNEYSISDLTVKNIPIETPPQPVTVIWAADAAGSGTTAATMTAEWAEVNEADINSGNGTITTSSLTPTRWTVGTAGSFGLPATPAGGRVYRATMQANDADAFTTSAQRTELGQHNPPKTFPDGVDRRMYQGQERYIALNLLVPSGFHTSSGGFYFCAIQQLKVNNTGNGPLTIVYEGDRLQVWKSQSQSPGSTNDSSVYSTPSAPVRDQWIKWLWHIKWSTASDGFYEVLGDLHDGNGFRTLKSLTNGWTLKFDSGTTPAIVGARIGIYRRVLATPATDNLYFAGYNVAGTRAAATTRAFGSSL